MPYAAKRNLSNRVLKVKGVKWKLGRDWPVFVPGKWDLGHWDRDLVTGNAKELSRMGMG